MAVEEILVPTDFGTGSRDALERACDSMGPEGGKIFVLHVIEQRLIDHTLSLYPDTNEADLFARLQERARQQYVELVAGLGGDKSDIEPLIVQGVPFMKIVQLARDLDADMIVMTVHHGSAHLEQFLFGSTAERVMRIAPCPILIVPEMTSMHEAEREAKMTSSR